jgi:hypothetical protein
MKDDLRLPAAAAHGKKHHCHKHYDKNHIEPASMCLQAVKGMVIFTKKPHISTFLFSQ